MYLTIRIYFDPFPILFGIIILAFIGFSGWQVQTAKFLIKSAKYNLKRLKNGSTEFCEDIQIKTMDDITMEKISSKKDYWNQCTFYSLQNANKLDSIIKGELPENTLSDKPQSSQIQNPQIKINGYFTGDGIGNVLYVDSLKISDVNEVGNTQKNN